MRVENPNPLETSLQEETGLQELKRKILLKGSQAEFAASIDISPEHLSLVLSGQRGVSADTAIRIRAALDIEISRFAGSAVRRQRAEPQKLKKAGAR
jgi:transcriptional regulator with XRE-family HTH domain